MNYSARIEQNSEDNRISICEKYFEMLMNSLPIELKDTLKYKIMNVNFKNMGHHDIYSIEPLTIEQMITLKKYIYKRQSIGVKIHNDYK